MRTSECDLVIVGVGGQGVILISDVIGRAAVMAGKPVCGAETHGMAQRGGSVINHTRIGCRFSPMVASGGADVLVALEPAEALRYSHFLSLQVIALVNTRPVLPVTVTAGSARYPPLAEILTPLRALCGKVIAMDAT
ncbi:MAG: 2-oxoacid:acceptor oxidoreductase family protein, partial [Methanothrix sp.]|nr:2-oxoacid:acceptor oxidoreductase family protein [Methanothrix sp.]